MGPRVLCGVKVLAPLLYAVVFLSPPLHAAPSHGRVVVYGSTPAGCMAAVAAARQGAETTLVSPTPRIGGMVSGGLGETDKGNSSVIGGLALEFFQRVGKVYGSSAPAYQFEPHVALRVFQEMLSEAGVKVVLNEQLSSASLTKFSITSFSTVNGTTYDADVFVDASYEGDLLAAAGVPWRVGREAASEYNETTAGRSPIPNDYGGDNHQFHLAVHYTGSDGAVLPLIYTGPVAPAGGADSKVQAYNFRLCLTQNSTMPEPDAYDPARFLLAHNWMLALNGSMTSLSDFMIISHLPNGKTDINNHGPISTDYIGGSWQWPNATHEQRRVIFEAHKQYTLEFFHFLRTDDAVPASVRAEAASWGLAKDEFVETGGWPSQLYVREGRRMVSDFVFTERDRVSSRRKTSTIGCGSYNIDNHHAERILLPHDNGTWVLNEGNTEKFGSLGGFEIPYAVMTPPAASAENLLVPTAVSASHSGYGCIRLEPQWMVLGHAAGVAAVQAIATHTSVQGVNVAALQATLLQQHAVLHY